MAALPPPLLYASTHHCADLLYFGQVEVHDPFIAFGRLDGKKVTVQSPLEFGRVKKTGGFDLVLPLEECRSRARAKFGPKAGTAEIIATVAREQGVRRFRVADTFPAALYLKLTALGLKLDLVGGLLFPEREIKTAREAEHIREGNRLCSVGFTVAERILRAARIKGRTLVHRGTVLTSESLRFALETAIREQGGDPRDTIVAGGDQACDPHERGSGPLRPHELIIIDVFPRVLKTGYFGDMTRTYLKGRPREVQRRMVATVREAQKQALRAITAGVDGREVHGLIVDHFTESGYETRHGKGGSVGFFHGTGHGLGLEVHDPGRISPAVSAPLKAGAVLTVEPGLYYPGLGGCRWEDVVQVTQGPAKMLSRHPYQWEIK
ncbi:putative peptidase [Lacunisphaera limnophila]|uniref:Putative peptidase n=1 Tax=Lacunisphaera limnophila TaxID=1838286 RepID=A0A1D8AZI9_9BACT|nr:Xaa-Pro peptidase family protein [Lacunisphaera limnophila]AOS46316.1 putative peptidase [Lacunisphaera limnophila]